MRVCERVGKLALRRCQGVRLGGRRCGVPAAPGGSLAWTAADRLLFPLLFRLFYFWHIFPFYTSLDLRRADRLGFWGYFSFVHFSFF